jgi:SAM-dependent methyltransferase
MKCRNCQCEHLQPFIDLGSAPPSNAYISRDKLNAPEKWFPLRVLVCSQCWLVQTEDFTSADELFSAEYAYFSSYSDSWLRHSREYVELVSSRFQLGPQSLVVEVAANDGYLLQYVQARGIPCLGIEPTASTAAAARIKGLAIIEEFFGVALADELVRQGKQADLMAANNVLAHVPDINDFVAGFARLLKPTGVATFEFPHLLNLVNQNQFDTIYHEHFSYLSLLAVDNIVQKHGLAVFDVEELPTHGGSLRVYVQRTDSPSPHAESERAALLREKERQAGMAGTEFYENFQSKANAVKNGLLSFLIEAYRAGKRVAAYGAAAKGNTLLNYAGIRPDLIAFVVDRNPEKQQRYMPGSRIPIVSEEELKARKPDYVVILPWNLCDEITTQLAYIRDWGGQFVAAIPQTRTW